MLRQSRLGLSLGIVFFSIVFFSIGFTSPDRGRVHAQGDDAARASAMNALPAFLAGRTPEELEQQAAEDGNAVRGAILFHGPLVGCAQCHSVQDSGPARLGPSLVQLASDASVQAMEASDKPGDIVESMLYPSKQITEGYRTVRVLSLDGSVVAGVLAEESEEYIKLQTAGTTGTITMAKADIDAIQSVATSLMPDGLLRSLTNRQQFDDLVKYVLEIRRGGASRARELQPTAAQLAVQLPEYESRIDHAGFIRDWDQESFARGRAVFMGLCVNCHGTLQAPGSLASAPRFGEGNLKYGSDPYAMYQTLTSGAGLMLPQPWMVPQQKYDVVHFLREHFLREHNPRHFTEINDDYLAQLPSGDERGPEPQAIEPWSQADYGPRLINTYEIGSGGRNIAQKGIALQLDQSPGGIAHGRAWAIFDHDTLRVAGVWTSGGFIDWNGIHFNGRHQIHPSVTGDILLSNPTGPGWADPETGSLQDDSRTLGRDGKQYGPLPRSWAQYKGLHQSGRVSEVDYEVGGVAVRESFTWSQPSSPLAGNSVEPTAETSDAASIGTSANAASANDTDSFPGTFVRHIEVEPHADELLVVVATLDDPSQQWQLAPGSMRARAVLKTDLSRSENAGEEVVFDGSRYVEIDPASGESPSEWNMATADFSIRARVRLAGDGTIFARAPRGPGAAQKTGRKGTAQRRAVQSGEWAAGGQSLFVRDGRLTYDVGWVGAVHSSQRIDDGHWHTVGASFDASSGQVALWIDGAEVAHKRLAPDQQLAEAVWRIGHTSENFPEPSTLSASTIARVQLFSRQLGDDQWLDWQVGQSLEGDWKPTVFSKQPIADGAGKERSGVWMGRQPLASPLFCGLECNADVAMFQTRGPQLLAKLKPSPTTTELALLAARRPLDPTPQKLASQVPPSITSLEQSAGESASVDVDLFPEAITTQVVVGRGSHGFAVDELSVPKSNPWSARLRLTGLDFFRDPDRLAVCTWDGDVWLVTGLQATDGQLKWKRIAFGLFQPLGLKIIDETIYLTCRDQLMRLDDTNADGVIDYYHCVNNDHQVTEHFHEFAMGLQTDDEGNFYYAKSARHALKAVVPHHGTLLKVSRDGTDTDILATGFRAANGVCLNPDGSFIVTDQEGHWNPKNRINWVTPGGFYGNMFGYHSVSDVSDEAMEQPLCWITNAFDRSPAELLWVDSPQWGPLSGQLLNLSYGYGKIYVVPFQSYAGQHQGGMCALPIDDMPTGLVRGRFSPHDGQLYTCGLSAWASSQTAEEGGLYRVRYTGQPAALPIQLEFAEQEIRIGFSEPLSQETALDATQFALVAWDLERTARYGSDHLNERRWKVTGASLSKDRRQLVLQVPELQPTWCVEIRLAVVDQAGQAVERVLHGTVHWQKP